MTIFDQQMQHPIKRNEKESIATRAIGQERKRDTESELLENRDGETTTIHSDGNVCQTERKQS